MTQHAGQQHLAITPIHGINEKSATLLTEVSRRLKEWKKSIDIIPTVNIVDRSEGVRMQTFSFGFTVKLPIASIVEHEHTIALIREPIDKRKMPGNILRIAMKMYNDAFLHSHHWNIPAM